MFGIQENMLYVETHLNSDFAVNWIELTNAISSTMVTY